jgi:hypothetical protein
MTRLNEIRTLHHYNILSYVLFLFRKSMKLDMSLRQNMGHTGRT